jgi:hypothetical protein
MVSWTVHPIGLSQVVTTTDSKSVSLQLCRFETCRTTGLFLSEQGLKIHSWTVSWEACLNLVLATLKWISQQNLNCLLDCDSAGSKPADEKFFSLSLYLGIRSWMVSSTARLIGLSQVATDSKSVSLGLCRFETGRTTVFFFSRNTA